VGVYRGNDVRNLRLKVARGYLAVRTGRTFQAARRAKRAVAGLRR
jgi:hypothetical protein